MPSVEFDVPYFFNATHVPEGKRKPVDELFFGWMKVAIDSVSSEDAPAVVTITREQENKTHIVHSHEGEYFEKYRGRSVSVQKFTVEELDYFPIKLLDRYKAGEFKQCPNGEFRSIEGCDALEDGMGIVEDKKSDVREAAKQFLFIDGVLHKRCNMPTIVAHIGYYSTSANILSISTGITNEGTGACGMKFAIGDLSSAEAWAADRIARESETALHQKIDVEVHHPHLLPTEPILASEAVRIGHYVFDRDIDFKVQSDTYVSQWMVARRAIATAAETLSDDAITEMLEALKTLYEIYGVEEDRRQRRYHYSYELDDDVSYKALMGVYELWENRPILSADYGFHMDGNRPGI